MTKYLVAFTLMILGFALQAQPGYGSNQYVTSILQTCTHNGLHPNLGGIPIAGCYTITDEYGRLAFAKDGTILQNGNMIHTTTRMGTSQDIISSDTLDLSSLSDGIGLTLPDDYIPFGKGTSIPDISNHLIYKKASNQLAIGTDTPGFGLIHVHSILPGSGGAYTQYTNNTYGSGFLDGLFVGIGDNPAIFSFENAPMLIGTNSNISQLYLSASGNIGINTSSPNASAAVDITSTTGALLLPRMTTTQRDNLSPVAGMVIFNTTTGTFQGYTTSWTDL